MRADVEHEIAATDKTAVEPVHRRAVGAVAVIDTQRAENAARGPQGVEHCAKNAPPSRSAPRAAPRFRALAAARFPPAGGRRRCVRTYVLVPIRRSAPRMARPALDRRRGTARRELPPGALPPARPARSSQGGCAATGSAAPAPP